MSTDCGVVDGQSAPPVFEILSFFSRIISKDKMTAPVVDVTQDFDRLFHLDLSEVELCLLEPIAIEV